MILKLLSTVLVLATLSGCGGGGSNNNGSDSSNTETPTNNSSQDTNSSNNNSPDAANDEENTEEDGQADDQEESQEDNQSDNGQAPMSTPADKFIVIDQFGYLPSAQKIAVIRDPHTGFDADEEFIPGENFQVVRIDNNAIVFSDSPVVWNSGNVDDSSGDKVWWFDFSAVNVAGSYYILDADNQVRSHEFQINADVYRDVLKHAFRTFFYQRSGFAKQMPFADVGWVDGASHLGPLQDSQARLYNAPNDVNTQRDLQGGWYDAGDYSKYTNWTAEYVIGLLHAYQENPAAWGDDFDLPESGNGIPDILDEVKWGLDFLMRMQNPDGSVLSVVGVAHAFPPSAASGQSLYGTASTSAALSTSAAMALGASVFNKLNNAGLTVYVNQLESGAVNAWQWAQDNPNVIFNNNNGAEGTGGLAAGNQETDDYGRLVKKIAAATYLYELTNSSDYREFVENQYGNIGLISNSFADDFRDNEIHMLLYFSRLQGISPTVSDDIQQKFITTTNNFNLWSAVNQQWDPYRSYITAYTWGSNATKSKKGFIFYLQSQYQLGSQSNAEIQNVALDYLHYLHGVNPLGKVYLSNMAESGAENSVDKFFHSWFMVGSSLWSSVKESSYGPAPGFLVGGPNPYFNCSACDSNQWQPPLNQPDQKSYKDMNDNWPIPSWEVSENSNGYQTNYLRLLSKFVNN